MKFDSVASSVFSFAVLSRASRALELELELELEDFLKLTLTICSLGDRKPLGSDIVPIIEVPWKG